MIIDQSYFTGDIFVPNTGANTSAVVSKNRRFDWYIAQYEPEILIKGLGINLYGELLSNIQTDPLSPEYGQVLPTADQKWSDLVDGTDYGDKVWRGLRMEVVQGDEVKKMSLIAYYVFYKYWQKEFLQRSTTGVMKADMENGEAKGPSFTMEDAWRSLYEWYGKGIKCTCTPWVFQYWWSIPGYFDKADTYKKTYVDLYTFLHDNRDTYPGWTFTVIENRNRFGL